MSTSTSPTSPRSRAPWGNSGFTCMTSSASRVRYFSDGESCELAGVSLDCPDVAVGRGGAPEGRGESVPAGNIGADDRPGGVTTGPSAGSSADVGSGAEADGSTGAEPKIDDGLGTP